MPNGILEKGKEQRAKDASGTEPEQNDELDRVKAALNWAASTKKR